MLNNYVKRSILLLGVATIAATASAGAWRDVTGQYVKNHNFAGGWQGAITAIGEGVGEVYCGAFNIYQTLPNMPKGDYTLTVNAFYRCGTNTYSSTHMEGTDNHNAYIYINGEKTLVKGLMYEVKDRPGEGEEFDANKHYPNGMSEANAAFQAGKYLNTVTTHHPGGDMVIGIANTGGYDDEWCCFDNFKLTSGSEDLTSMIKNYDFTDGMNLTESWDNVNSQNGNKTPDVNKRGGVYRKTNASPYNYGQQITLPKGKYRFGMLTFLRYGGEGDSETQIISCKGEWKWQDESYTPKKRYTENNYTEDDADNAYVYVDFGTTKMKDFTPEDEFGDYSTADGDVRVRIKDIWEIHNGDFAAMPHNEPLTNENGTYDAKKNDFTHEDGTCGWDDSGIERQAAAAFVNNPELYRHWAEFTVAADDTKVWVGFGKSTNSPTQYWNPFADIRLEWYDENAESGVDSIALDTEIDENAPVEYFNMQGVRVAEPTTGLYIVRQGNKVSKQLIRK